MKKLIFIAVFLVIFNSIIISLKANSSDLVNISSSVISPLPTTSQSLSPTLLPTPAVGLPQILIIPKLNLEAPVEQVGLDNENRMDVPKDVNGVGWFNLGFKPGEKGSAVMAGHLDTVTGSPAVFYDLDKLTNGDQIIVTDTNGKKYTYIVTATKDFPYDQLPLEEVFNSRDKSRLNLITCRGVWDQTSKNYSNRMVIYSELQSS